MFCVRKVSQVMRSGLLKAGAYAVQLANGLVWMIAHRGIANLVRKHWYQPAMKVYVNTLIPARPAGSSVFT